jgi:hypothetical protein
LKSERETKNVPEVSSSFSGAGVNLVVDEEDEAAESFSFLVKKHPLAWRRTHKKVCRTKGPKKRRLPIFAPFFCCLEHEMTRPI